MARRGNFLELSKSYSICKARRDAHTLDTVTGTDAYNQAIEALSRDEVGKAAALLRWLEVRHVKTPETLALTEHTLDRLAAVRGTRDFDVAPGLGPSVSSWIHQSSPWIDALGFSFGVFLLLSYVRARRRGITPLKWLGLPLSIGLVVGGLAYLITLGVGLTYPARNTAFITADAVVRSGPAESYAELQRALSGGRVYLTGKTGEAGWVQIHARSGGYGWIPGASLLLFDAP
jgi:hypothetical protein